MTSRAFFLLQYVALANAAEAADAKLQAPSQNYWKGSWVAPGNCSFRNRVCSFRCALLLDILHTKNEISSFVNGHQAAESLTWQSDGVIKYLKKGADHSKKRLKSA